MTTEVDDFSDSEVFGYPSLAWEFAMWNGRHISRAEAPNFSEKVHLSISQLVSWIGGSSSQGLSNREIQPLDFSKNDIVLAGKSHRRFWKKVLIVVAAVVVVTTVVVIVVTTGGAAAGVAAVGTAVSGALKKDEDPPGPPPQNTKIDYTPPPPSPPPAPSQIPFTTAPIGTAPPPILIGEALKTPPIVFGQNGVVINGQFSSYQDLKSPGGNGLNPSINYHPYQPDLSVKKTSPTIAPSSAEPIKSDVALTPPQPSIAPKKSSKGWQTIEDAFQTMGWGNIDSEVLEAKLPPPREGEYSCTFRTPGKHESHWRIAGINGINTTYDEACDHANFLASLAPGYSIGWFHNHSNSVGIDVLEAALMNIPGFSPLTSLLLEAEWKAFHKENADRPKAKYLQFCHSQGAIHVRNALENLPQEIRNRVIVVAIAPAEIVPRDICFKSFNYASKKDPIHHSERAFYTFLANGMWTAKQLQRAMELHKQLILLDPHPGAVGIDHDFQSPTFIDVIQRFVRDYLIKNGEYDEEVMFISNIRYFCLRLPEQECLPS